MRYYNIYVLGEYAWQVGIPCFNSTKKVQNKARPKKMKKYFYYFIPLDPVGTNFQCIHFLRLSRFTYHLDSRCESSSDLLTDFTNVDRHRFIMCVNSTFNCVTHTAINIPIINKLSFQTFCHFKSGKHVFW